MRKFVVAVLAALLVLIPIASAGANSHASVETEVLYRADVDGGWSCAEGQKIEDPETGTYSLYFDGFAGSIEITVNSDKTFDFDTDNASHVVDSVLVKGGPNALLWSFSPGVDHWDGLHAPQNPNNGKYYGLSHLCFLTDKK